MKKMKLGTLLLLCVSSTAFIFPLNLQAAPITYNDETIFQTTVGTVSVETFEDYILFEPVSVLPALGGTFDVLSNGSFPTGYDQSSGGTARSGSVTLMNNDKIGLPGLGSIVFIADSNIEFSAFGLWNTGGDDTVRLSVYDANNILLATTVSTFGESFIGISGLLGGVRAEISAETGNGWFSIDDLQTATISTVPIPSAVWLFGSGLLALVGFGSNRSKKS